MNVHPCTAHFIAKRQKIIQSFNWKKFTFSINSRGLTIEVWLRCTCGKILCVNLNSILSILLIIREECENPFGRWHGIKLKFSDFIKMHSEGNVFEGIHTKTLKVFLPSKKNDDERGRKETILRERLKNHKK